MTFERQDLTETWSTREFVLASGERALKGYAACIDLATGLVVVGKSATGLLPLGTFRRNLLGDGVARVEVRLYKEVLGQWFVNDQIAPVAASDIGHPCFLVDGQRVSMDGTGRSTAGRVLVVAGAQVFIDPGIAMSGPSDADTDVAAIAAAVAAAAVVTTPITTTGTAPAFVLTPSPALGALLPGTRYSVVFHAGSKRVSTLNVSGLGPKKFKRYDNLGAKNGGFYAVTGVHTDIIYDGTDWVVIDQRPDYALRAISLVIGRSWIARSAATQDYWFSVCWAAELGLFVAVAGGGLATSAMTSPDGFVWTTRTVPASFLLNVCWSPELMLFVALAGFVADAVTSPDGISWTRHDSASADYWASLCWAAELGLFVAVASAGNGTGRVQTSPDGVVWTLRSAPDRDWASVCWAAELGLFCAVSVSGVGDRAMTSPDGVVWTLRSAPDRNWASVCWAAELGLFCAVSVSGAMTSPDGVVWTFRSMSPVRQSKWSQVIWVSELSMFVTVGIDFSGYVAISPDGINWQERPGAFTGSFRSLAWSPEKSVFVAVADTGLGQVMTSAIGSRIVAPERSFGTPLIRIASGLLLGDATSYWVYMGYSGETDLPIDFVRFAVVVAGVGAQAAEIAIATSLGVPPSRAALRLVILAASGTLGALTGTGLLSNTSKLGCVIPVGTHWWAGIRTHMATTQPTIDAVGGDCSQGRVLAKTGAAALVVGQDFTADLIAHSLAAQAPALLATSD
jgi:hypothetical protein